MSIFTSKTLILRSIADDLELNRMIDEHVSETVDAYIEESIRSIPGNVSRVENSKRQVRLIAAETYRQNRKSCTLTNGKFSCCVRISYKHAVKIPVLVTR
jgi:hypothetical protein